MADAASTRIDTADVLAVDASVALSTGAADYGITSGGFVPKPFARLLAEKLALARRLFGDDVDLLSGSVVRKLLEVTALEDARQWAALAAMYANCFVATAVGDALSLLGAELGLARPYLSAHGTVTIALTGQLPDGSDSITIRRGARLSTLGHHDVAMDEDVTFSGRQASHEVAVVAFHPGPEHDLDPNHTDAGGNHDQRIDRWNLIDEKVSEYMALRRSSNNGFELTIAHTKPLTGGDVTWPDDRYRELLLSAPRSLWSADALEIAVSLVPGVRQVVVRDAWGGLDINQSIFGNFNFVERMFSEDRDLFSPYYVTVLVAPTPAAIWAGPGGLAESIASAIEDLRPISIFPAVERGDVVSVGVAATLTVRGLPLPVGTAATVNASAAAQALKRKLSTRLRAYVDSLRFGEPVRAAEVTRVLMSELGVADVTDLALLRWPASFDELGDLSTSPATSPARVGCGENLVLGANSIATFVDDVDQLVIG
jgi:hypothetical protein